MLTILSLFDYSGNWASPYRDAGYDVVQVDLKLGGDVRMLKKFSFPVRGILAAPPCTEFSVSGAQYWKSKDDDGRTAEALALVDAVCRIVIANNPLWLVIENPVGRLSEWLGDPVMRLGGKSEKTKELRSITPQGFSRAFFEANP